MDPMAEFAIRRLPAMSDDRRYHLFDDQGQLLLIADFSSPWLPQASLQQVRFARADGRPIATLDLPRTSSTNRREQRSFSYAIIFDYAVYAIINVSHHTSTQSPASSPHITLEAGGRNWIILPHGKDPVDYALFRLPHDTMRQALPEVETLPEPTAMIRRSSEDFDFVATIGTEFRQREIILLSLIFLLDGDESV
jgi:hypothetical protein